MNLRLNIFSKSILFSLLFIMSISCTHQNKDTYIRYSAERLTTKKIKNPYANLSLTQISNINQLHGLWECVMQTSDFEGEKLIRFDHELDIYFDSLFLFELEYPCYRYLNPDSFVLRGDSLYLESPYLLANGKVHRYKQLVGFIEDTLVIRNTNKTNYYVKKEYDKNIMQKIIELETNPECYNGTWDLIEMSDGIGEKIYFEDKNFQHVPRKLNITKLSTTEFYILNDTLFYKFNDSAAFIIGDISAPEYYHKSWSLSLRDIANGDGYCNFFEYQLSLDNRNQLLK